MSKVKAIPEGYHTLTTFLSLKGADQAIEFYKKAFGAEERGRFAGPDGKLMHAEIKIGDSIVMLGEAMMDAPSSGTVHLYVENADQAFERALKAGATVKMPLADQFWGDRYGVVSDPFGQKWSIASHREDVPMEEMQRRAAALFANRK
jgi:uncharacterized glyoxalase superfamily protein PhnB